MAEPTPYNLTDAVKPSGFVDFYQMLGVTPDSPTDAIRSRINERYLQSSGESGVTPSIGKSRQSHWVSRHR